MKTANIHGTDGCNLTGVLPEEDDTVVYFMWSAGKIKIGYTADIMRRWDELQIRQALKFVKVNTKNGFLTDLSITMILVELERRGITFDKFSHA